MSTALSPHLGGFVSGGDAESWYPELWRWAHQRLGVRSVLDVGCGEGQTLRFFQGLGCEILGIDGSPEAVQATVISGSQVQHDFTTGPFVASGHFDLVWSCEFVEHVAESYVDNFLAAFACSSRFIMMTHALPGQAGHHHVNCQPNAYWIGQMRRIGFRFRYRLTRQARKAAAQGYFRRSGLVFERVRNARSRAPVLTPRLLGAEWFARRAWASTKKRGPGGALRQWLRS